MDRGLARGICPARRQRQATGGGRQLRPLCAPGLAAVQLSLSPCYSFRSYDLGVHFSAPTSREANGQK